MKKTISLVMVVALLCIKGSAAFAGFDGRHTKESVIHALALLPTRDKKTTDRVEKAIKHIQKSLREDLWETEFSLTRKGKKAFEGEKKAVKNLEKITDLDVSEMIHSLVGVDETLAQIAIDMATETGKAADCANNSARKCRKSRREIEKGDGQMTKALEAYDQGKYDKAVDHYKKAWGHAQKAMKKLPQLEYEAAAVIGPEGGVVEVTDRDSPIYGARLEIPRGALTGQSLITLGLVVEPAALPAYYFPAGKFIEIGPQSIAFDSPVTAYVPYNDEDNDGLVDRAFISESKLGVAVFNESLHEWESSDEVVTVDVGLNLIQFKIQPWKKLIPYLPYDTGASLRIMTYNTALTAFPMPQFDGTDPVTAKQISDVDRAWYIAKGIDRINPDIVVLNEVFDSDAGPKMVDELHNTYHYGNFVALLDSYNEGCPPYPWCLHSGLMLFSRLPFVPLSNHPPSFIPPVNPVFPLCIARGNGSDWCSEVGFAGFAKMPWDPPCLNPDCGAHKGAGLVRVKNPNTDENFTVVFAHFQASYGDDTPEDRADQVHARANQLDWIKEMINTTLTSAERQNEVVFQLGDHNINGNQWHSSDYPLIDGNEWWSHFSDNLYMDPDVGFYACGLNPCPDPNGYSMFVDSWKYESSPDDIGRTMGCNFTFEKDNKDCGERLDYILHNNPPDPLTGREGICAQHLYIAWDVGDNGGRHQYSDHLPIVGDFNREAPLCSPISAREVSLTTPGATNSYSGVITYPGSMQWHKITEPGTYAIGLSPSTDTDKVHRVVYEAHDLSRPYAPYPGKPSKRYGPKYVMGEPPYYVRVYSPDRTWTGGYNLIIHKLACSSDDDSCPLDSAAEDSYPWPAGPVNADDTIWYTFMTDIGYGDPILHKQFPLLKFHLLTHEQFLQGYDYSNFSFEIASTDPGNPPVSPDPLMNEGLIWDDPEASFWLYAEATDLPGTDPNPANSDLKEYYVKVKRKQLQGSTNTRIYYYTNLTYLIPYNMENVQQQDDLGDDDIYYTMEIDGPGVPFTCASCPGWLYLGEFDTGTAMAPQKYLFNAYHKYVDKVIINLMEYDCCDPNDYLQPWPGSTHPYISVLAENKKEETQSITWANAMTNDDSSYWYVFHYKLSHKRPPPP